jgi:hypothetical protein
MTRRFEKKLSNVLAQSDNLAGEIIKKTSQLHALNLLLQKNLDSNLALHCKIANWRDQTLVLEMDSAAWATQLRFCIPELLMKLQATAELRSVKKIEYYIKPEVMSKTVAIKILMETAEQMPVSALRRSLVRLAKNTRN